MKFKLLFTSSERDCQCLRIYFLEERKCILDIGRGTDYYMSKLLASAFTWMLPVKVLTTKATGGHFMNEPSVQQIITAESNMLLCSMLNIKHFLKYFLNRLWLRTHFQVTRKTEYKVPGWYLSICLTLLVICFVFFFFPLGAMKLIGTKGLIQPLWINPFTLNQRVSA